jgi:hypothetical protein
MGRVISAHTVAAYNASRPHARGPNGARAAAAETNGTIQTSPATMNGAAARQRRARVT